MNDVFDSQLLLTSREAARALAISERTLWGMTRRGEIPAIKIGRAVRYSRAALVEWIAQKAARVNGRTEGRTRQHAAGGDLTAGKDNRSLHNGTGPNGQY